MGLAACGPTTITKGNIKEDDQKADVGGNFFIAKGKKKK